MGKKIQPLYFYKNRLLLYKYTNVEKCHNIGYMVSALDSLQRVGGGGRLRSCPNPVLKA